MSTHTVEGIGRRAAVGGIEVDYLDAATKHALVANHGKRAKIKRAARRRDRRTTNQELRSMRGVR